MITNKLLPLLIAIGLTTGCATRTPAPPSPELSYTPTPLSTRTGVSETVPASEALETPADEATPSVLPPAEYRRPPIDDDESPPTPVEMAKADLARRLNVDVTLIEVVETTVGRATTEDWQCVADESLGQWLLAQGGDVRHIHLSVKGHLYCYLGLGDLVIYCPAASPHRR